MKEGKRIQIGMMKIMPIFDIPAWDEVEERFGSLDEALEKLKGGKGWRKATIAMTAILCSRTLVLAGDKPLDERTVEKLLPPRYAMDAKIACVQAISKGLRMDYKDKQEESERIDLVLREIEKKEEPAE